MHLIKLAVFFGVIFVRTLSVAVSTRERRSTSHDAILKRGNPTIGHGIDVNDPQKGGKLVPRPGFPVSGAFSNTLQLANYVTTTPGATNDAVFKKYFNPEDKQIVKDVFNRLLGDDGVSGVAALAKIKVVAGAHEPGDTAPAFLEGFDDPEPNLVLRENAWVYPDRDDNPDACNTWEDEGMSQEMYLLGSVLLHEYTHWDWFLRSIHNGQVIDQDNGHGWQNARALDKNLAKYNADSYGWYATELFWAIICAKDGGYDAPPDVKRGPNSSSLPIRQTVFSFLLFWLEL